MGVGQNNKGLPMQESSNTVGMTIQDIYQNLLEEEELILEIYKKDEERFRKRMASTKSKFNAALKEQGLIPDDSVLSFQVIGEDKDAEGNETVKLLISLGRKGTVQVVSMALLDKEL